jgi:hypothetical protein
MVIGLRIYGAQHERLGQGRQAWAPWLVFCRLPGPVGQISFSKQYIWVLSSYMSVGPSSRMVPTRIQTLMSHLFCGIFLEILMHTHVCAFGEAREPPNLFFVWRWVILHVFRALEARVFQSLLYVYSRAHVCACGVTGKCELCASKLYPTKKLMYSRIAILW